jgi:hypothetical protein
VRPGALRFRTPRFAHLMEPPLSLPPDSRR